MLKRYISVFLFIATIVGSGYALDYLRLTNRELTVFGERLRFYTGDTLDGPVHSNSQISIMGSPVFLDRVSTTAPDFEHGAGYAPVFLGPPPVFNSPIIMIPNELASLRSHAADQGHLFSPPPHHLCLIKFFGDSAVIFTSMGGVPFDSSNRQTLVFTQTMTLLFFDCPVRVMGLIAGRVVVGTSFDLYIDDDIRYIDSDPITGRTPPDSPNYLALASSKNIKISNTVANGRENSAGLGRAQTDLSLTNIVITAALYALGGSFTFENQNDPDSGYDYGSQDERGTAFVYGGVVQERSGYLHRANRGGTGYLRHIRYDQRLRLWYDFVFDIWAHVEPDTLNFGDVPIGVATRDTVRMRFGVSNILGGVNATNPFVAQRIEPFNGMNFQIPVSITPEGPILYQGFLTVSTEYRTYQIPIRACGVPPHGPQLTSDERDSRAILPEKTSLCASPNPFNLTTEIRYTLAESGPATIVLYNLQGSEVRRYEMNHEASGQHNLRLNAEGMASGVYFAQLITNSHVVSYKLLLLK